jgi:hypothetical protein
MTTDASDHEETQEEMLARLNGFAAPTTPAVEVKGALASSNQTARSAEPLTLPVAQSSEHIPAMLAATGYSSPTVAALDEKDRPQADVVCVRCTAGLWFATPAPAETKYKADVKCFCSRMRTLSWQTFRPTPVTDCDGFTDQPAT